MAPLPTYSGIRIYTSPAMSASVFKSMLLNFYSKMIIRRIRAGFSCLSHRQAAYL